MFRNVTWGAIGVRVGFIDGLDLAREVGFEGADVPIDQAVETCERESAEAFVELYDSRGLKMGSWGLPVPWQGDDDAWRQGVDALQPLAEAAQAVGATRCCTWVPSWSDTREMEANRQFHLDRFTPLARVLGDHGCRLGLEFLGPKTLRAGHAHEFVYNLPDMLALCREIGPNVGLLLDAWHWYTSGGDEGQLAELTNGDIVAVHVNDAPAGVPLDEQIDNRRLLPCASGVIPLATFMKHLKRADYDGPVTVEPFNDALNAMEDRAAAEQVKASLDTLFALTD